MRRRRASSPRLNAWLPPRGTGGQPRSPGPRRSRVSRRIPKRASRCRSRPMDRPPRRQQPRRQGRLPHRCLPPNRPHQARQLSRRRLASRRRAKGGRQRAADGPPCRPGTRSCSATRASETSPAVLALNLVDHGQRLAGERRGTGLHRSWNALKPGSSRSWNAMDPGFHCAGTHWIRGSTAFQLVRGRTVALEG